MVRLHVKHRYGGDCGDEEAEFLYECRSSSEVGAVLSEILQIANLQLQIHRLSLELDPYLAPLYVDQRAIGLIRALSEAKAYVSKDQVLHGKSLSCQVLRNHFRALEKELNLNYQLLGFSDPAQLLNLSSGDEQLQIGKTRLQWAGKELTRDKQLCHYIGNNEKTKITVRLQSEA